MGKNYRNFLTGSFAITSTTEATRLPAVPVPLGRSIIVAIDSTNAGVISIAPNKAECENRSTRFNGLSPNGVTYLDMRIQNLCDVWVIGTSLGDIISWYVEQEEP